MKPIRGVEVPLEPLTEVDPDNPDHFDWLLQWMYNAEMEIARLRELVDDVESVQRWIPVSERLPEKYGRYILHAKRSFRSDGVCSDWVGEGDYSPVGDHWFQAGAGQISGVTHWMPFPPLPSEQKEKTQ